MEMKSRLISLVEGDCQAALRERGLFFEKFCETG